MINQLFDINSIRQNITEVNQEVDKIKQNLQNLTAKIKIEVPSDIQTQINSLNTTFNSINGSLNEISAGQLRYAKAMTESAKQAKLRAQEESIRNRTLKQTINLEEQIALVLGKVAKSEAEAIEQNRILRAARKQLDLTVEENITTLKIYNQQIDRNTEFIRKNSDAQSQQKMNIGNYNSVWKGMNVSVQQLVRELPSAKYGLDIFFLAISNNIPMLMDSIKAMQAFNKEMVATGQLDKKVSIGKELLKSLISWQTAIMLGVTLLVQYGDEIINWVGNLFKGEKALSATAKAQEALNNAWKDGTKDAQEELVKLKLLSKAYYDVTTSTKDREKALKEIKEMTKKYLGESVANEIKDITSLKNVYDKLTTAVLQSSIAKAKLDELEKIGTNVYKLQRGIITNEKGEEEKVGTYVDFTDIKSEEDALKKKYNLIAKEEEYRKRIEKLEEKYKLTPTFDSEGYTYYDGIRSDELDRQIDEWKDILKRVEKENKAKEKILNLLIAEFKTGKKIEDTLSIGDIISTIEEDNNSDKTRGKTYAEILADIITKYGAEPIEDNREREIEAINLWFKDQVKVIKNIGEGATEEEIKAYQALVAKKENDIAKVNEKYDKKLEQEAKRVATAYNKMVRAGLQGMDNTYESELHITETAMLEEQTLLNEKYLQNKINEEQYQKEMLAIRQKYAKEGLETQIRYAEFELNTLQELRSQALSQGIAEGDLDKNLTEENLQRLAQLIERLKAELGLLYTEQGIEGKNGLSLLGMLGLDDESLAIAEASVEGVADIMGEIDNLVNASFDARLQRIEEETEAVEKSHEKQLESLQNLYNQGAISQEEYEARKRLQEELTEKKKEELAKKEAELKNKQAKYDKASAIAQALINTALAITSAATVVPFIPLGSIAMGIASAMGALQVATIMATPLPKYAQGTKYHKGGLAVVGDGGKQEVVMTAKGAYLTPDTPTVVNLPRGAKVIPDAGLLNPDDVHWAKRPFMSGLSYDEKGKPIIINDYSSLEKEQRLTRLAIEKQRKEMRKYERNRQLSEYKKRAV